MNHVGQFLLTYWPAIVLTLGLIPLISTARGRRVVSLFRGTSIEQLSATASEQIATVQAAYEVVSAELARQKAEYETQIGTLNALVESQRTRIEALEALAKGTKEIAALALVVDKHHKAFDTKLDNILRAVKP